MKTRQLKWKTYLGVALISLFCALEIHAQQRGGGAGGFRPGGFGGGFGGGFRPGGFGQNAATSGNYNNNGTVGTATFSVDPTTHDIIVTTDKDTSAQIQRVIESLDEPVPQVLIKAVFLEVDDNKALDFGVEGNYTGANGTFNKVTGFLTNSVLETQNVSQNGNGGNTTTTTFTPVPTAYNQSYNVGQSFGLPQTLTGAAGNGGLYQLMGYNFTATLQAIATAGKAQVLSRPSILASDGQMAEIVVGQYIYLPSSVSLTAVGGTSTTVPEINGTYQNVGIQLDVTPFIGENNLVEMILQPQITSIDTSTPGQVIQGGSLFTSAVYAPNLDKRSANTVVVTPEGQTVVIGGLISNNKSVNESKVPILGDIPILGNLFKFSSHADQKTDLLMFITPHIVRLPSQLNTLTASETGQAPMITNSISERELDRFLEGVPAKKNP